MNRKRAVAAMMAAIGILATTAGTAGAVSTPIGTGGERPSITVDGAGRAHIAWERKADGGVQYCRVPAGGATCEISTNLGKLGLSDHGALNVYARTPNEIQVFASATCNGTASSIVRWASADGGATWSAPACKQTGSGTANPTRQANVLDAQGRMLAAGGAEAGKYFNALPPDDTASTQPQISIFTTGNFYDVFTAIVGGGAASKLVAAAYSLDGTAPGIRYSVFNGAPDTASLADLNTEANWTRDLALPGGATSIDVPQLISGPSGLFLVYKDYNQVANDRVGISRFDTTTNRFGAPLILDGSGNDDFQSLPDSFQDAAGRIHLIWGGRGGLRYALSTDGGASFAVLGTVATQELSPTDRRFATGANGQGWVVFTDINDRDTIRIAPLVATPDAVPVPTPPGGTPPGTVVQPISTKIPGSPGTPIKRATGSSNGGTITFGVPKGCVQPGQQFVVTMTWRKQKRKGNKFVKVRKADFYIGTRLVKTDTRAPFRQTLRVTASAKPGSTVRLRARAHIKMSKGKKIPKKSIFTTIKVCG